MKIIITLLFLVGASLFIFAIISFLNFTLDTWRRFEAGECEEPNPISLLFGLQLSESGKTWHGRFYKALSISALCFGFCAISLSGL